MFDAMTALHGVFTAALPDVQVIDGPPPLSVVFAGDVVAVGYAPGQLAATGTQVDAGLRPPRMERLDVVCMASSERKVEAMVDARDACRDLLNRLREVLLADPTLGGAVHTAAFGPAIAGDQYRPEEGVGAAAQFTVHCRAYV
jgi:hypothetical protein